MLPHRKKSHIKFERIRIFANYTTKFNLTKGILLVFILKHK